ncbi:PEGA domain protein [Pseudodesulfovibrio mercurii]|uniref:PEGA domain protein n=1 Tax=Pseudodesulfovibrio mercurii TaxID=641491 RepID=F0JE87_9BACT|nr:PEGA domain-containing protein [Pseudodesulfovibrio mercurii]EGB14696.1 PEGA domain protein [Pseudodesulfovibrio mercurii]
MARTLCALAALACLLTAFGCGVPKQKIPVSTDPLGAVVYADGDRACGSTPCSVRLDRRSDHLLTIVKEGYEQVEVVVRREFKPDRAIRDGVISGIIKGGDPEAVAAETAREVDEQERSGEAYVLEPSIVTIRLTPKGTGI